MSHGVECKTTNQKTRVRNFTKKKENRTASSYVYGVFGAQSSRDCTVTVLVSPIKTEVT